MRNANIIAYLAIAACLPISSLIAQRSSNSDSRGSGRAEAAPARSAPAPAPASRPSAEPRYIAPTPSVVIPQRSETMIAPRPATPEATPQVSRPVTRPEGASVTPSRTPTVEPRTQPAETPSTPQPWDGYSRGFNTTPTATPSRPAGTADRPVVVRPTSPGTAERTPVTRPSTPSTTPAAPVSTAPLRPGALATPDVQIRQPAAAGPATVAPGSLRQPLATPSSRPTGPAALRPTSASPRPAAATPALAPNPYSLSGRRPEPGRPVQPNVVRPPLPPSASHSMPLRAPAYHPRSYASSRYYYPPVYYGYAGPARPRVYVSPWVSISPVWWGPVLYPAGFGISWSSRSGFSVSFSTYSPFYAYRPYYDSWGYGGWGYSSAYYGGWSSGWYGGFSYVYNPWPAYRTYYFYSPPETVVVERVVERQVVREVVVEKQAPEALPEGYRCFCACHCNGQVPCTCEYPCGSELGGGGESYRLGDTFSSYTVSLNPETIWASYAGFDRIL